MTHVPVHPDDPRPVVLVIDDSKDVHRLLAARLRKEEFSFATAFSGPEGIKLAQEILPAVILLDLDMPEMDGFQVLRNLKEISALRDRPIIVLSGLTSAQDKVIAFDLGAMDYVTKPFDLTELRVRVRSALRLQRLLEMLSERAHVDGLTGLWNRTHFDARWKEAVSCSRRNDRPLSIAIFDADHFKSVNDNYGHPAGDMILQGIANILIRDSRQTDIACRFGGEEFALIMPDTAPEDAQIVCGRIRETIANIAWPRHPERHVTVSIGIAGCSHTVDTDADTWFEFADKALYKSKQDGRNCSNYTALPLADPGLANAG